MANSTDVPRFLQAVFGADWPQCGMFANLAPQAFSRDPAKLSPSRGCYWSVASFTPKAQTQHLRNAIDVRALVIDDVGTAAWSKVRPEVVELALGAPTAVVESSEGNFQWTWRLAKPVPKDAWGPVAVAARGLLGQKVDGSAAVSVFRLPMGKNVKRGGFDVRLVSLDETVTLDASSLVGSAEGLVPVAGSVGASTVRVKDPARLMRLVPNPKDLDRDEWQRIGHRLWALTDGEEDGFEAFDEWSQLHSTYDADKTRKLWDSIDGADATSGKLLLEAAAAADPKGFEAWQQAEAGGTGGVFDDGEVPQDPFAEPPKQPGSGSGTAGKEVDFVTGAEDQILTSMENAGLGLAGLGVRCRYDEFHRRFYVGDERLTDHMAKELRGRMLWTYGKDFGAQHVWDALILMGLMNKFNPVVDMLDAAEKGWDGVARLDRLGPDYFHSEDTALARACFRKVMLAAVRRARRPGCKFDQILVIESPEGWNKSTAWAVLAGEGNFSDTSILGKSGREVQEELADIWIHENSDLAGLTRAEVETVKAFASRVNDRARPAYGRVLEDQPRQSIEVGTTNSSAYLLSTTGNRRFWTFSISAPVDLIRLRADRAQLWGEAAALESKGETLVLDAKLWPDAEKAAEQRRVIDPWEDELANLKGHMAVTRRNGKDFVTRVGVHEILRNRGLLATANASTGKRIGEIMRKLGWEDCRYKIDGVAVRGFEKAPLAADGDALIEAGVTELSPKNPF